MRYREMSDADFDLEWCRTNAAYDNALRVARGAAPTLQVMQGRWDKCNAWHARLNEMLYEKNTRAASSERWLDQEIGI